jgi:hypothetical protein
LDCEFSRLQTSLTDGHFVAGCTEVALALKLEKAKDRRDMVDRLSGE